MLINILRKGDRGDNRISCIETNLKPLKYGVGIKFQCLTKQGFLILI